MSESSELAIDPDSIDETEVAAMLGCTVSTVQRHARKGTIPSYKVGWLRRYRRSSILAFIARAEREEVGRSSKERRRLLGLEVVKA